LIDIDTLDLARLGQGDPQYDLFDQNLYDWVLQFTRPPASSHVAKEIRTVDSGPAFPVAVTLSASPERLSLGQPVTLTWTASGALSCVASGDWQGKRDANGSEQVLSPAPGSYGYVLTCSGPDGVAARSAAVTVGP
jgi:hypothetical protein